MSHIPYYGEEPKLVPPCPPDRRTVVAIARAAAERHPYAYLWTKKPQGPAASD